MLEIIGTILVLVILCVLLTGAYLTVEDSQRAWVKRKEAKDAASRDK
jgi:hypothetical protein